MLPVLVAFLLVAPQPAVAQVAAPQTYGTFPLHPDRVVPVNVKEFVVEKFGATSPMVRIAGCESGFRQFDTNGNVLRGGYNPKDVGVFQINEQYHKEAATKIGINLETIDGNLEYAKKLYDAEGTKPWQASAHCWS